MSKSNWCPSLPGTLLLASAAIGCATPPREPTATHRDSPGAALYRQRCGQCHDLYPPYAYRDHEWPGVIAKMQIEAGLSDDEANAILEFLLAAN